MPIASAETIERSAFARDIVRAVLDAVHGAVLDVGAGMSRYREWILEKGTSYTTVDIAPFPGIDIVGDAMDLPIEDATYDTVVSTHVLEHVREPWVMVEEIERVLRPDGTAIVLAPFVYPFHADPTDYFRFSEQGIRSLFERVGMRVELCAKFGSGWFFWSEVIKQKFFSPYERPHPWWKRRLCSLTECSLETLNRWTRPGIVYVNVVCVAHKDSSHP